MCRYSIRKFAQGVLHQKPPQDSDKSSIAHACFHKLKIGMKIAVVAFVEVSIRFLKIQKYYFSCNIQFERNQIRIKGQDCHYCSLRNDIVTCLDNYWQCYTRLIGEMNYVINLSPPFKKEDFTWVWLNNILS